MTDEKERAQRLLSRFGLGLAILGGIFSVFGVFFLFTTNESLSWTSVQGFVVNAEVKTHVSHRPNPAAKVPLRKMEYYVSVNYTYEVDDKPYFSSQYSFGEGDRASRFYTESSSAQEEAKRRFAPDSHLTVYYNPEKPTSAVLKPGWNWGTFVPLLLGLFFGGAGWLFYIVIKRSGETEKQSS